MEREKRVEREEEARVTVRLPRAITESCDTGNEHVPACDARGRAAERARARSARLMVWPSNAQKGRFPSKNLTSADAPPPQADATLQTVAWLRPHVSECAPDRRSIGRHGRSAQSHCSQSQCWSATTNTAARLAARRRLSRHEEVYQDPLCTMALTGAPAALQVRPGERRSETARGARGLWYGLSTHTRTHFLQNR